MAGVDDLQYVVPGFNGAASLRTRKPGRGVMVVEPHIQLQWGRVTEDAETYANYAVNTQIVKLQWGRVTEDAETIRRAEFEKRKREASMGPRH